MSELRDGLQDELARVQRDIQAHIDKARVVDQDQWLRHLQRLQRSRRDLQERIEAA